MEITQGFKLCSFFLPVALLAGIGFSNYATAQERTYLLDLDSRAATELGSLGGAKTYANALNDLGQIVGWSNTPDGSQRAFITGPDGEGMRDLGTLGGARSISVDINDSGQVVVIASDSRFQNLRSFITGPNGVGVIGLGNVYADAINNAGQVVGSFPAPYVTSFYHRSEL